MLEQLCTGFGKRQSMSIAGKQLNAQCLFEGADLFADRRLSEMKFGGCGFDAAMIGRCIESTNLAKFQYLRILSYRKVQSSTHASLEHRAVAVDRSKTSGVWSQHALVVCTRQNVGPRSPRITSPRDARHDIEVETRTKRGDS